MLHGRRIEITADSREQRLALAAIVAEHADLDQLVREQIHVDLVQHRGREPVLSYRDDRMQRMRPRAERRGARAGARVRIEAFYASLGGLAPPWPSRQRRRTSSSRRGWPSTSTTRGCKEAARLGYRSRAAFKLIELAAKDKLIRPGMRIVGPGRGAGKLDPGAARAGGPGASIVAIDLLPMAPIAGVTFVQADFREDEGLQKLESALGGHKLGPCGFGLVPQSVGRGSGGSGAVGASGRARARILRLAWLQPGGDLVVKAFQGEGFVSLRCAVEEHFAKVYVRKPQASRDRSREVYLVAKGLQS